MIKPIVKDPLFLGRKSLPADKDDLSVADDLLDTLKANCDACVGMAANMIGVCKKIIVFINGDGYMTMFNPEIIKCSGKYETAEGCLSLSGVRNTVRYNKIKVKYQNAKFETRYKSFSGIQAQIIQHEIDHCNSILI